MRLLAEVIKYTKAGLSVLPLAPRGKRPAIDLWKPFQQKPATEVQVRAWWKWLPDANAGIITGAVSRIIVLDVDGPEGIESIKIHGMHVPPTPTVRTGGGGLHYYFRHPGLPCRNFARKYPGIDFRGDGGYVVAPPSMHTSGNSYQWADGLSIDDLEPADCPPWLLDLIEKPIGQEGTGENIDPLKVLDGVPEGERDNTLFRYACRLRRQGLKREEATALVLTAAQNCTPPFPGAEARIKVESAWKYPGGWDGDGDGAVAEWPEPDLIGATLLPVKALDPELIPGPLRGWVLDVSHRMQCPPDFVAVGAVVVAGALIGAGCGIRPKQHDHWFVVPNLWGGVVAPPSKLKTPALAEAMKPLARLEAKARDEYDHQMLLSEADQEVLKAQRDAIKKEMARIAQGKGKPGRTLQDLKVEYAALEPPPPATRQRYKTNDATIEKISELLNENPRGILVFRDELIGLLSGWDKPGRESDRAFFLEAWNGYGSFTTDRIGRGTIDTQNMCVSILGGIQPGKLVSYLNQAMGDIENDGLMQRMQLLVYPDPTPWQLVDEPPDRSARTWAYDTLELLALLDDFTTVGAQISEVDDRAYFAFSDEAQSIFYEWWQQLENGKLALDRNPPVIAEHLSKYRSLMPSLALIFHVLDVVGGLVDPGPVGKAATERAAGWCDYLETHARRVYGMAADMPQRAASELAKKIEGGHVKDGFTLRGVYRNCWYLLDRHNTEAACDELVDAGWLRKTTIETGGRPRTVYQVHPEKLNGNAQKPD